MSVSSQLEVDQLIALGIPIEQILGAGVPPEEMANYGYNTPTVQATAPPPDTARMQEVINTVGQAYPEAVGQVYDNMTEAAGVDTSNAWQNQLAHDMSAAGKTNLQIQNALTGAALNKNGQTMEHRNAALGVQTLPSGATYMDMGPNASTAGNAQFANYQTWLGTPEGIAAKAAMYDPYQTYFSKYGTVQQAPVTNTGGGTGTGTGTTTFTPTYAAPQVPSLTGNTSLVTNAQMLPNQTGYTPLTEAPVRTYAAYDPNSVLNQQAFKDANSKMLEQIKAQNAASGMMGSGNMLTAEAENMQKNYLNAIPTYQNIWNTNQSNLNDVGQQNWQNQNTATQYGNQLMATSVQEENAKRAADFSNQMQVAQFGQGNYQNYLSNLYNLANLGGTGAANVGNAATNYATAVAGGNKASAANTGNAVSTGIKTITGV